ncbi:MULTISPECIES: flippase [unclassified Leptolyngbya]|uniref:flippase n=1 Tax=unclassified Leptolyngbya TaxID=2650499 RepID=UPI0016880CA5|nr:MULTISPECIES: flippase [unclassified Leptolyngbya]MBD1910726.1 flippase [Leptolyngbya sp. FACHB-8]MBD2158161.1 flippase [Leptolyngbya sp. FACHB-16]
MQLQSLVDRFKALSKKPMVQGTLWMLLARGIRIFIQAAYFVIIARALGAEQFGAFSGVLALVSIFTPFSSCGAENVMVMHVARNRSLFGTYWGNTVVMTFICGGLLMLLALVVGHFILPASISPLVILILCVSDLICLQLIDASAKAFLSVDRLAQNARISIILSTKNLVAAIAFVTLVPNPSVMAWSLLYMVSTAIAAIQCVWAVHRQIGPARPNARLIPAGIKDGIYFGIGLASQTVYNDIDKTMLASLSTLNATGIYAAAYRIITVARVPVQSITSAAYARFFRHGEKGISGSYAFAKRLIPFAGGYGAVGSIALILFAPVVPYVLGDEYKDAVGAIRWLAPLLFFKSISLFGADALTGAGFQGIRSALQVGIAILNTLLNFWLIPAFSWKGASWATLISDGLLMVIIWGAVFYYNRRQKRLHTAND